MLDALRRGAQSWVAKILFAILVVSFAVWGVADVFRGFGQGSLAKVGSEEISVQQFQMAYQNRLYAISRQAGQRLTPEQARLIGLPNQVLSGLIGATAIEEHARALNLALSDAALAEGVRTDPSFKGMDGRFSRTEFDRFLYQINMSEHAFLALRRKDQLREQITKALSDAVVAPRPTIDLIHAWREETRTLEYAQIDADKAVSVAEPDDAKLAETYEQNKRQFVTPEFRKLSVLLLSVDALKPGVTVEEEEIKKAFEAEKDSYETPERRRIQQIAFPDRAAAEAARQAIAGGKSFVDVAKDTGAKETDINLGLLAKRAMIDPKIADAAFALPKDKVSDVVEGRFATVLLKVTEIEAGKAVTFEEVKGRVRERLAEEKAAQQIPKLHDAVEDGLNAGKSLKEVAESLGLRYLEIDEVDRNNKTSDQSIVIDTPDGAAIIAAAFEARPGVEHAPVELSGGGSAWVDVRGVTEERQKPLEEVKAEVKALYMKSERRRVLSELAGKLVERINSGTPLATVAAEVGGRPETTPPLTRSTVPQGLPQAAVTQAFALPQGQAGSAETSDGRTRVIFKVVEAKPAPPPTQEQVDRIAKELRQQMSNDVLTEYVTALQGKFGVRINEPALRRAIGLGTDENQ